MRRKVKRNLEKTYNFSIRWIFKRGDDTEHILQLSTDASQVPEMIVRQ